MVTYFPAGKGFVDSHQVQSVSSGDKSPIMDGLGHRWNPIKENKVPVVRRGLAVSHSLENFVEIYFSLATFFRS